VRGKLIQIARPERFTIYKVIVTERRRGGVEVPEAHKDSAQAVPGQRDLLKSILTEGEKGLSLQRYKGLGEMNPEQVWETKLDPETRTLLQVEVDDLTLAVDIFSKPTGDVMEPRYELIQKDARNVEHPDS